MNTKLSRLTTAYRSGDIVGALRIAAKFPQLGAEKEAITRAWAAVKNPAFYREIGRNPEELIEAGRAALACRYGL